MTRKILTTLFLLAILFIAFFVFSKDTLDFIPQPQEQFKISVKQGELYPFPWIGAIECSNLKPGCFLVESIDDKAATLSFERFAVKDGSIQPVGLTASRIVTKQGTREVLYSIEEENPKQQWVYAQYQQELFGQPRIEFLKYEAFVTKNAKIYRGMLLDLTNRSLQEKISVEADEPVTLISSGAVEKAIPKSRLTKLTANDQEVQFVYPEISLLNLPQGETTLRTEIIWEADEDAICPWSVYEGRKMSLPVKTELTIKNVEPEPFSVSLSSFGIPEEVWQDSEVLLEATPPYERIEEEPLSKTLYFSGERDITVKIKPVIIFQDVTFPVIVCVER